MKKIWRLFLTRCLPDWAYVKYRYFRSFGKNLNLKSPKTLNEKLQYSKLYGRSPLYTQIADKYDVRRYVSQIIAADYLIPLLGIYDSLEDLFAYFPHQYPCIIKPTHDSGGGVILWNAEEYSEDLIIARLKWRMERNFYHEAKEWEYKNIRPRVVVERLLHDSNGDIPNDYKFNCFNGTCEFIYCSIGRSKENYRKIYDRNWMPLNMTWCGPGLEGSKFSGPDINQPPNFHQMILLAEKLSSDFPYIRVDLYNVEGKIYFGELTRHHGGGFEPIIPHSLDLHYGLLFDHNKVR